MMRCFFHSSNHFSKLGCLLFSYLFTGVSFNSGHKCLVTYMMQIFVPSLTGVLTSYNVCDRRGRGSGHLQRGRLADSLLLLGPLGSFLVSELHLGFLGWPLAHD